LLAMSWGGLGVWDSALVNLERSATEEGDSLAALRAYGLAAVGVWMAAVDHRDARSLRARASAQGSSNPVGRAELAWIDGVIAAAGRRRRELGQARAALRQSGDPAAASLDRSLGAFEDELRGATRKAGDVMAALEWEQAKINAPDFADHPWAIALDRLAGSRWLLAAGRNEEALRLLRWVDGPFFLHPSTGYGLMFSELVRRERKRIEEGSAKR